MSGCLVEREHAPTPEQQTVDEPLLPDEMCANEDQALRFEPLSAGGRADARAIK
jgi:hypothetical protein